MSRSVVLGLCLLAGARAAPEKDLVTSLPGFPGPFPFKLYSGYLDVPGPVAGYDSLKIHYEFHTSMNDPTKDPVCTWHQGGPGGSSLYGAYGEMGYLNVAQENGNLSYHVNKYSWNQVANMLYLESPAGSDDPIGFSSCYQGGKMPSVCEWNDKTQAEAYAHTLRAFYAAFPEFKSNKLYLSGESYAGQYIPNIATYLVENMEKEIPLTGILVGNGCWGGDANNVNCNGPNSEQNDLDMYFGKGLISKPAYEGVYARCKFPLTGMPGLNCTIALEKAFNEVGPHNVYDIYDNCPQTAEFLKRSGKSMRWFLNFMRSKMGSSHAQVNAELQELGGGGYDWLCGGLPGLATYMSSKDVQTALHLDAPITNRFNYDTSGPASITLYPNLVKKIRVLIYNGDADACVPYKGNEEWTEGLAAQGIVTQNKAWHPWFAQGQSGVPAGYATSYNVPYSSGPSDFTFITIRLAGHMVPQFQPAAALSFFKQFMSERPF
mmetsp:Transcript_146308/g.207484  ORF Transcript_146308/g.207484 Transcript_146308/m.207484 type:complete len:490 (+) Transcript_146308:42-1511(+)